MDETQCEQFSAIKIVETTFETRWQNPFEYLVGTLSSMAFGDRQSALNHALNVTKLRSTARPGLIGKECFQS